MTRCIYISAKPLGPEPDFGGAQKTRLGVNFVNFEISEARNQAIL